YALMLKMIERVGGQPVPPSEARQYVEAWSQPNAFTSMINWYRAALRTWPVWLDEPRIHVPTLLIWGEQDRFLDRALAQQSIDHCDHGRLVYLPDASHWAHHEAPEQVANLVIGFLNEASGGR